jgi:hypothetical protein
VAPSLFAPATSRLLREGAATVAMETSLCSGG